MISLIASVSLIFLVLWTIWNAIQDAVNTGKRLHQIPCANCQYFTGDYHLKCTLHPKAALTEEAINCLDYCSPNRYY
ncbi:hypothetical protein ACE1CI_11185 [Aerosakkonemataceae cyanobacterium BLCC-F50]|uniref:Uncharacterized protein n=1 Tax=Floridaenema flaviceps BLCC-F50 TaxID=3153642 RepID=A0ABV4XP38_9CYAN